MMVTAGTLGIPFPVSHCSQQTSAVAARLTFFKSNRRVLRSSDLCVLTSRLDAAGNSGLLPVHSHYFQY